MAASEAGQRPETSSVAPIEVHGLVEAPVSGVRKGVLRLTIRRIASIGALQSNSPLGLIDGGRLGAVHAAVVGLAGTGGVELAQWMILEVARVLRGAQFLGAYRATGSAAAVPASRIRLNLRRAVAFEVRLRRDVAALDRLPVGVHVACAFANDAAPPRCSYPSVWRSPLRSRSVGRL
jgi:hypothetical protein